MDKIKIGEVVNCVGIKGQIKIYSYAENPDRFEKINKIFIGNEKKTIESVTYKKSTPILKLKEINTRDEAEKLRGKEVFMSEDDLPSLEKGQYYIKDIIGFMVEECDGKKIGILKDIEKNTAQDMYIVEDEKGKKILIPGVKEIIISKDLELRKIIVRLPKGLLEL